MATVDQEQTTLRACELCGAVITEATIERHAGWHRGAASSVRREAQHQHASAMHARRKEKER